MDDILETKPSSSELRADVIAEANVEVNSIEIVDIEESKVEYSETKVLEEGVVVTEPVEPGIPIDKEDVVVTSTVDEEDEEMKDAKEEEKNMDDKIADKKAEAGSPGLIANVVPTLVVDGTDEGKVVIRLHFICQIST